MGRLRVSEVFGLTGAMVIKFAKGFFFGTGLLLADLSVGGLEDSLCSGSFGFVVLNGCNRFLLGTTILPI